MLMKNDLNVSKELKIKYYQMIFEAYYIRLAGNSNNVYYNDIKLALSQLGLKLKSLGVDVK
jgi:hypothetical protein